MLRKFGKMNILDKEKTNSRVPDIKEAYKNLHASLGDECFKQYASVLRLYLISKISKLRFDEDARKLLCSPEQLHLHNLFFLSLSSSHMNVKYVSQELSFPNEDLLKSRVCVTALDQDLDGAEDAVTDAIVAAVQLFLKNIITAMVSRTRGYKIRENNFQHAVGLAAPNPWLRNTSNIVDATQEAAVTVSEEGRAFAPVERGTLDVAQQQAAFSFACGAPPAATRLTLRCLYDTLHHDPHIINNHTIHAILLERILAHLDAS